jgi:cell division protein FtsL
MPRLLSVVVRTEVSMRDSVMWFLVGSVVVTALFVVNIRHQHRLAYLAFQTAESLRDDLNDEWGQLLVESNVWASAQRVEKDATEHLSMRAPRKGEMKYIGEDAAVDDSRLVDGARLAEGSRLVGTE